MIKTFRLTGPLRTLNNRAVRHRNGGGRPGQDDPPERLECTCVGPAQPEGSTCRLVLQQNSRNLRGTLLVRSDDLLTFFGISAVRTRLGRSSRGEHEHCFRQLFRSGIPREPTVERVFAGAGPACRLYRVFRSPAPALFSVAGISNRRTQTRVGCVTRWRKAHASLSWHGYPQWLEDRIARMVPGSAQSNDRPGG